MRNILHKNLKRIIAVMAVFAVFIAVVLGSMFGTTIALAESTVYSNVLDDLQTDTDFNEDDYPADSTDYSLSVIQVAESTDGELLIYVYQPNIDSLYDLTATSINISKTIDDDLYYKNYDLELLSQSDVFFKYRVEDFELEATVIRYYDISAIYRTYYTDIDGEEIRDNTTSELAIAVAQRWQVVDEDGDIYYYKEETDVVTVTAYAGFVRYPAGTSFNFFTIKNSSVDSHYIAFDCDYDIDELYEVDISFNLQSYWYYHTQGLLTDNESYDYEDVDTTYYDNPLTIKSDDDSVTVEYKSFGSFKKSVYSWDRIMTSSDFISNVDAYNGSYDSDYIDTISSMQYVISFYETEYTTTSNDDDYGTTRTTIYATKVTDTVILRLKFLSQGTVYNLGAVCNKITEGDNPDVIIPGIISGFSCSSCVDFDWKLILGVLLLLVLLIICAPFLPYVVKFVVWIVCLPFKGIAAICKGISNSAKKRRQKKEDKK